MLGLRTAPPRKSILSMKLYQAAALALVGWYLMVPSLDAIRGRENFRAYSHWSVIEKYDHIQDCEARLLQIKSSAISALAASGKGGLEHCSECYAECIASDDPRLAK